MSFDQVTLAIFFSIPLILFGTLALASLRDYLDDKRIQELEKANGQLEAEQGQTQEAQKEAATDEYE